uniref:Uncharacterized protein n=1 Tax=Romanomermis culicivorax TaxID=13658 RepID=A0A915JGJ2_ROMCU
MYASCQSRAGGLAYTIAKAGLENKKDPEPNYPNIQVIDPKKAHDIVEVEKNLKKKVGYRVKHTYNRPATSKVPRRWYKRYCDRKQKSETLDRDRKRKHESGQRDEKRREKSMSKEKRQKGNDEESESHRQKEQERKDESHERKQEEKRDAKEHKDSRKSRSKRRMPVYYQHDDRLDMSYSSRATSLDRARTNEMTQQGVSMSDPNGMIQVQQQQLPYLPPNYPGLPMVGVDCLNRPIFPGQLLTSTVVPLPTQFQMPLFPVMQFQRGQGPYYHQFLVPPGLQMLPPTIIPPICNVQGEERMDIPGPLTVMQPPQRPPSTGNPDYILPLKRETEIGQPGRDHSGQRHK